MSHYKEREYRVLQLSRSRIDPDVVAGRSGSVSTAEPENRAEPAGGVHPPITHRPTIARRDFILLPILSVATIVFMFVSAEVVTRFFWPASEQGYCMSFNPQSGPHGKSNCTTTVKIAEAPAPVTERFNSCGYRSLASCGPKPAGVQRIAVLGSSIAEGYIISYNEMFASQMTTALEHSLRRPVEFQNLGAEACLPIYSYRHLNEALRLHPDAIVLLVNPWDVEQDVDPKLLSLRDDPRPINQAPAPVVKLNPVQQLQFWAHSSRTMLVAQHFMLQNRDTFLKLYLMAGGDHTDFVRCPFTAAWQKRFAITDLLLGDMARKIHAAGIPFLLVGIPERAQVLMLKAPRLPAGVDPYAFTHELSQIARKHGMLYVDGLKLLSKDPDPEQLFYVVDGHPTPRAHELLGKAAAQALASDSAVR